MTENADYIIRRTSSMNLETERINAGIERNSGAYIKSANSIYNGFLEKIAGDIAAHREERPVVLLAGPSGSGKTTTSMMIEKLLDDSGTATHTLSMDNYFRPLSQEEQLLAAKGEMDLESPSRVDIELLNTHLEAIMNCEPIELPKYNFSTSTREESGVKFQRNPGELVIFEGIHALNPEVITVPDSQISNIYVSVRTRVTCGELVLHPSKVRLMRRMVRDKKFRKRSVEETVNMFRSVENGQNKYIMPYKYRSNYDVDTFIAYELNVYRSELLSELEEMRNVPELHDIITVLENLSPLDAAEIPPESLICEFLGNGQFAY